MKKNDIMQYSHFSILKDESDGLLELTLAKREGDGRSYYLRNNLDGRFEIGQPSKALKIVQKLNEKLAPSIPNELIIGFAEGSTLLAWLLAFCRDTNFVTSTKSQKSDYLEPIVFEEEHRAVSSRHYLYPIKPCAKIIMVEDELSTGNTMLNAYKKLCDYGVDVIGIAAIVEIANFAGKEMIKRETGISVVSVTEIELHEIKSTTNGQQN